MLESFLFFKTSAIHCQHEQDLRSPALEVKWQAYWEQHRTFRVADDRTKPKFYCLDMFPYPSGSGLHVGHLEGYTATDIVSRYKRMRGFNVLHPMGWDAFGLPAEQYAVKTGIHPVVTTAQNIATFKRQMKRVGLSYDWERELSTIDPDYYRWTQWIFLKLFERGLAYVAEVPVNWCPALGTVLANEEIVDGKSEVGGFDVIRKPMRQWVLKITAYADRLLEDLKLVEWPASTLEMQKNWIGRSIGAEVEFDLAGVPGTVRIFTTRPDTLFGATYMVLVPGASVSGGRHDCRLPRRGHRLSRGGGQKKRSPAAGTRKGKDRGLHRRLRAESGEQRAIAHLDCRLRVDGLWDRGHHGCACA